MVESVVRPKPKWFAVGTDDSCVVFFKQIWVGSALWPDPPREVIAHARVHLLQQLHCGQWKWLLRWLFSKKWRLQYEAEGFAVQVKLNPQALTGAVVALSGPRYRHCASPEEAQARIEAEVAKLGRNLYDTGNWTRPIK